jgi:quinohemoprotein ethanol dehydrogenase
VGIASRGLSASIAALLALTACSTTADAPSPRTLVDDAALTANTTGENWLAYGRLYNEQRYSPLANISDATISGLGVDWYLDLPNSRSLLGTPLVVDGVMYFEESYNVVRAVNALTGQPLWTYDPKVIEHAGDRLRIMWDYSRGLAFWGDKVYTATYDGRLIAIDAATGSEVWSVMTVDPTEPLFITGVPKVFKGKVVIGNGGTELGAVRGYLTAYDAETGKQVWRWWVVPGNPADGFENDAMAMAAETWTGEWWKFGGGGTVWNGITYDPELDLLYIGTGNGTPWNQRIRSPGGGDNLFLCSIVALDPDTGEYRWHYQTVPGEAWDYNSNMDIVLADLTIDGQTVKALMHAPKNGFFYVLNRETGKLISAEPFAKTTWATHVDMATGRPVEVPGARYEDHQEFVQPAPIGAHSWHAMSYNPSTGLVYIPAIDLAGDYNDQGIDIKTWESPDFVFDPGVHTLTSDAPPDAGTSTLKAWNPVTQALVWEASNPGTWNAGTLTTAGNLVFQGQADGRLIARNAATGESVWEFNAGSGISAPPITFSVNGKQYISLLVGWGGALVPLGGSLAAQHGWAYGVHPRRLITFSLSGSATLPDSPPPVVPEPLTAPEFLVDEALASQGEALYRDQCALCHGPVVVSGGYAPDLRASGVVLSHDLFADVVVGGGRIERGMPRFSGLSGDQLSALQHYIRRRAQE